MNFWERLGQVWTYENLSRWFGMEACSSSSHRRRRVKAKARIAKVVRSPSRTRTASSEQGA